MRSKHASFAKYAMPLVLAHRYHQSYRRSVFQSSEQRTQAGKLAGCQAGSISSTQRAAAASAAVHLISVSNNNSMTPGIEVRSLAVPAPQAYTFGLVDSRRKKTNSQAARARPHAARLARARRTGFR